ncbi:hypothetical protein Stsp02_70360 [Streptomyces sp. NBRC 14336]|nr:hypothetical protein Stsp02_70360 [Streptomyces sp. NBRC 14336]
MGTSTFPGTRSWTWLSPAMPTSRVLPKLDAPSILVGVTGYGLLNPVKRDVPGGVSMTV